MIKIAALVPFKDFIENAQIIFDEHNAMNPHCPEEQYAFEEIVVNSSAVGKIRIDADVILIRGLFASILRSVENRKKDVPVVEIQILATDLLLTVHESLRRFGHKPIAIIGVQGMVLGVQDIQELVDVNVRSYILPSPDSGPALISQAVSDGCGVILGGVGICGHASLMGVDNLIVRTGRSAFWQSLSTAKTAAQISSNEQEKTGRLQAVLDASRDCLFSFNADKRIQMVNDGAAGILGLTKEHLGMQVTETSLSAKLQATLVDQNEYRNELLRHNGAMLNLNKQFIRTKKGVTGTIVNIQEVQGLQTLESAIRKKIYTKGHLAKATFDNMIATSPVMVGLVETAKKFSRTDSSLLLQGESGTGKEILAQSIHNHSCRKDAPFVAVNCAAIPENLLESEMFGYEPGAFTGAAKGGKAGFFELAHSGTVFLDEIGELSLSFQAKLLRVIQEREFMRLGGHDVIPVDIRTIAATNQNLEEMIAQKLFRQDLYFRLDVLRLNIPSLEERKSDIPALALSFLCRCFPATTITQEALDALSEQTWPGNVRQLFNICERLAVLQNNGSITLQDVLAACGGRPVASASLPDEKDALHATLVRVKYNRTLAAKELGMDRSTLWRKMKQYDL